MVEGYDKDHELNASFLELGCEQVTLYSFLIISPKNMGNAIDRLGFRNFLRGRKYGKSITVLSRKQRGCSKRIC